jgi:hypothetical protein
MSTGYGTSGNASLANTRSKPRLYRDGVARLGFHLSADSPERCDDTTPIRNHSALIVPILAPSMIADCSRADVKFPVRFELG